MVRLLLVVNEVAMTAAIIPPKRRRPIIASSLQRGEHAQQKLYNLNEIVL